MIVLFGNPPYVEYNKKSNTIPNITDYKTQKCGNLYAFVLEKSFTLLKNNGHLGMIIPISLISTQRMQPLREIIEESSSFSFISSFADRPACVFSGVHQKLCIILNEKKLNPDDKFNLYTTDYMHWYSSDRNKLYKNLSYYNNKLNLSQDFYVKLGNKTKESIINKMLKINCPLTHSFIDTSDYHLYLNMRMTFWVKCFFEPQTSNEYKAFGCKNDYERDIIYCLLNSNLFFMFWESISDCWHITSKDLNNFHFDFSKLDKQLGKQLVELSKKLYNDIDDNKIYIGSKQVDYIYLTKFSKSIIDKIDILLGKYYNFTNEELEYLKKYNLPYRMGQN